MATTTEVVETGSCWVLRTLDVRDDATVSLATTVSEYESGLGSVVVRDVDPSGHVEFQTATGVLLRLTRAQFLARWSPVVDDPEPQLDERVGRLERDLSRTIDAMAVLARAHADSAAPSMVPVVAEAPSTDLERVRGMLTRAGVVFEEQDVDRDAGGDPLVDGAVAQVRVASGDGPRNGGYSGFLTLLSFDASGALVDVGSWE